MLYWSVVFLVVSLIAGVLGFGGVSSTASSVAQTLFYIAIVLFVVSLAYSLIAGRRHTNLPGV